MARRALANLQQTLFPPKSTPPVQIVSQDIGVAITDSEVGYGSKQPMRKDDVELVQFLLDEFFTHFPVRSIAALTKIPKSPRGDQQDAIIKIDGIFGDQTNAGILIYQREFLGSARPDGIVSVAHTAGPSNVTPGGPNGSPITTVSYTKARTITSLAGHWAALNPGKDIAQAFKVQRFAPNLRRSLLGSGPLPF